MKYLVQFISIILLLCTYGCSVYETPGRPPSVVAIVKGGVTTTDNVPVEGAKITVFHRFDCNRNGKGLPQTGTGTSNAEGKYDLRYETEQISEEDELTCFLVEALPPDTSQYQIPELKEIDPDFREEPPFDTVTVNFSLESKE